MITTYTSGLRRTGLLIIALLAAAAVVSPAFGASESAAPPQSAIDNASVTWAAKAKLLDAYGQPMFAKLPPLAAIDNASATWAEKARLLWVDGRPLSPAIVEAAGPSDHFDWGDFGIGAAAAFGMALLAGGLAATTYLSRRGRARPQIAG
jgi:hypothetical protein